MIGFFMILVDSTIVAVANPSIMEKLQTDYEAVIWVTSAYLLAYAVPLLVAGRLGDQFGPKKLYLIGLSVFTLASLWCGLAGSVENLVAARVVQGVGAALLTPQTLSTITKIFPPERRGAAMSVWGATAGVATLVGPLAGGALVDHLGWQWIFFVNVPIGVIGLMLGHRLIPELPLQRHRFDVLGVLLSGAAMFLVVFGLQEGESRAWPAWIWGMIAAGVIVMGVFLYWQCVNKHEPLIPLRIFADRDFALSNIGVAVIGFAVTAMIVPVMFYAQVVCGLTPTRAALLTAPMAVMSGALAPLVGKLVDRAHPRSVIGFGFSVLAVGLTWLSIEMTPTTPIWRLVLPFVALGAGMAFIWAPLAATATRNLPPALAGAGSGVYNATRQVGSVLGSAGIAAFMTSRISAHMPGGQTRPPGGGAVMQLPEFLREPFSTALSQSVLMPALVALFGVIAAIFMVGVGKPAPAALAPGESEPRGPGAPTEILSRLFHDTPIDTPFGNTYRHPYALPPNPSGPIDGDDAAYAWPAHSEGYVDDDEDGYAEYLLGPPDYADVVGRPPFPPGDTAGRPFEIASDESDTQPLPPLPTGAQSHPAVPDDGWRSDVVQAWQRVAVETWTGWRRPVPESARESTPEPIGFAQNGFHVDQNERFKSPAQPGTPPGERAADGFDRLADQIKVISASFTRLFDGYDIPVSGSPPPHGAMTNGMGDQHAHPDEPAPRHGRLGDAPEGHSGRHYRADPDGYGPGKHSLPQHD